MSANRADAHHYRHAPLRKVALGQPELETITRTDGTIYIRPVQPLADYPKKITERLIYWARTAPDRTYLAARDSRGDWRKITYAEALASVRRLGQALLNFNLSADRPLLILSDNDLEHALLALSACHVGIAYSAISPAYSTVSRDFEKLRYIVNLLTPGLVFAHDGRRFEAAIRATVPADTPIVVTQNPLTERTTPLFRELYETLSTPDVDSAFSRVGPDTITKFLFTSGSTGNPKAVINTQRMICANQEMIRTSYAFMKDEPPVLLDWSPWNHTAGGNKIFNMALYNGGTLYLDDGRPTPAGIGATIRNLREISPTWYFNVPKGFEDIVPYLESEPDLRRTFFSRLNMILCAGAGMAQHTWDDLQRLSVLATGERILLVSGLGATETSPFSIICTDPQDTSGNCGVPVIGNELKLVPMDGKLDARIRGPNVTPGYWRAPELTAQAFDEEGFYKLGDALRFAAPGDASKGFYFDGRTAENFKLRSGTWVGVGALRAKFIDHFGPYVRDCVITGLNEDYLGALVFISLANCRALADRSNDASLEDIVASPKLREAFKSLLQTFARKSSGSSTLIRRMILLDEEPSLDAGEVTDKGSINQRAVLRRRAKLAEDIYKDSSPHIISIDDAPARP